MSIKGVVSGRCSDKSSISTLKLDSTVISQSHGNGRTEKVKANR